MGTAARNYSQPTIKKLFGLSGNICAFPGCEKRLVNSSNAKDSNICHIEAANPDGERYNPHMTDAERADYENLILLCIQHHDETNNEEIYTVDVLKKMKRDHESKQLSTHVGRNPSMIDKVVVAISDLDFSEIIEDTNLNVIDPKEKITFNNLIRNAAVVNEYKIHHFRIDPLYKELEANGSIRKERLLQNINMLYLSVRGKYTDNSAPNIEEIRSHADDIFDDVYNALCDKFTTSGYFEEDIYFGVLLVVVDAFIRCKILEAPN